jgi:ABC-type Mn2+/Zn2+ transport system permease subunit
VIGILVAIFDQKILEDLIGFVIYVLLLIILRQVFRDRKELKKETAE